MPTPRDLSAYKEAQDALSGAFRAASADPAEEVEGLSDPDAVIIDAEPSASAVFGERPKDPVEQEVYSGGLPMREAFVKRRVVDAETGEEDFEDEVQIGIDMRDLRNRMTRALVTQEINRRKGQNPDYEPTLEEKQALTKAYRQDAHSRIMRQIQRSNNENYVFIDDDPEGVLEDLQQNGGLPEPVANVVKAVLPDVAEKKVLGTSGLIGAWLHGRGGRTYQPKYDEATGEWKVAEEELAEREGILGTLEFVGQPAPSTYYATAIAAGFDREAKGEVELSEIPLVRQIQAYAAGEFTPEQIERVRAGEDMFTYAGEIGAAISPYTDDPEGVFATVVGAATAFGVAMVEPDLISVASFGAGKGARFVKGVQRTGEVVGKTLPFASKWSSVGKLDKVTQTAAVWAERLDKAIQAEEDLDVIADLERQAARALHDINPHLNYFLQSRLAAQSAMGAIGDFKVNNAVLHAISKGDVVPRAEQASGTMRAYLTRREAMLSAEAAATEAGEDWLRLLDEQPQWAKDFQAVRDASLEKRWKLSVAQQLLREAPEAPAGKALPTGTPREASIDELLGMSREELQAQVGLLRDGFRIAQRRRRQMLGRLPKDLSASFLAKEQALAKSNLASDLQKQATTHYADVAVLEHMRAMREGFARLAQGRPRRVQGAKAEALTKAYLEAVEEYGSAQRSLVTAVTPEAAREAQDALLRASTKMRKVTLEGSDALAAKGLQALDDAIETAAQKAAASEKQLHFWTDVAEEARLKPALGQFWRSVQGLKGHEFKATRERLLATAYADSLKHISAQYGKLSDMTRRGDLEKIDLSRASRVLSGAIDAEGRADVRRLLKDVEDIFGKGAVDAFLRAGEDIPEALKPFSKALDAARRGSDGLIRVESEDLHDFVSTMRTLRNAANMEGAEGAVATELRKWTQHGLDALMGPDIPSNYEVLGSLKGALEAAGALAPKMPAAVVHKHLVRLLGEDALARTLRARRKLEAAGEVVEEDALARVLSKTGDIAEDDLRSVVNTLNSYRRGAVEASTMARVRRYVMPRLRDAARMLQRTKLSLTNPAAAKLGMLFDDENMIQVGKGIIDHSKVVQKEIVEIASAADEADARAARMLKYMTDETAHFEGFRTVGHSALGNKSLWDGAALLWKGMTSGDRKSDDLLRALSRIWVKSGSVVPGEGETRLMGAAVKIIEDAEIIEVNGVRKLNLTFNAFSEKMLEATMALESGLALPSRIARRANEEQVRAMGYAAQIVGAAASVQRAVDSMSLRMVGITPETVYNVRRLLDNNEKAIESGYDEVYQLFARLGLPPKTLEQTEAMGKKIQRGIMAIRDSEGHVGAFPYEWHHHVVKEMEPLMKRFIEASDKTGDTLPTRAWEFLQTLMRVWRTSVTSGVAVISPRYLATNSFGLISQIGMEDRFSTAFRAIANGAGVAAMESWPVMTMRKILPGDMGAALDEPYLRALRANQTNRKGVLSSIVNALYNPCVSAVYDTQHFTDSVVLPSKSSNVTMGQLRRWLIEQGVTTSQASENMMEIMSRASRLSNESRKWTLPWLLTEMHGAYKAEGVGAAAMKGGESVVKAMAHPLKTLDERGQVIASLADAVEQRQRVALFTDLVINRGMHPEDAGRITREAAYDWNHAGTQDEAKLLGPMVLFYRAMKLMYRQGVRHAFDPFMRGFQNDGIAGGAKLYGGSIAKMRGLEGASENIGELLVVGEPLDYEKDVLPLGEGTEAYKEALAEWQYQQMSPWWLASGGQRMGLGTTPLTQEQRDAAMEARGKAATHITTTMPSHTVLEFVGHVYSMGLGLASAVSGNADGNTVARSLGSGFAELGGPAGGEGIQAVVDTFLGTEAGAYRGDPNRMAPMRKTEAVLAERFPDLLHAEYIDGQWKAPQYVLTRLRLTPVLGTELLSYAQPGVDISTGLSGTGGLSEDAAYYMRQVSGLGRTYPFDPAKELENKSKYGIDAVVQEEERRAGGKELIKGELGGEPGKGKRPRGVPRDTPGDRLERRMQRRKMLLEERIRRKLPPGVSDTGD